MRQIEENKVTVAQSTYDSLWRDSTRMEFILSHPDKMPTEITAWAVSDGHVFLTKREAIDYEMEEHPDWVPWKDE
jgi:hypothetical protein